jgi:hypothetical protein
MKETKWQSLVDVSFPAIVAHNSYPREMRQAHSCRKEFTDDFVFDEIKNKIISKFFPTTMSLPHLSGGGNIKDKKRIVGDP